MFLGNGETINPGIIGADSTPYLRRAYILLSYMVITARTNGGIENVAEIIEQ